MSYESTDASLKREVFTDSADFIGPDDSETTLEAYTVSCGVITLDNRRQQTVGIIHVSEGNKALEVLQEAVLKVKGQGLQLSDFTLRRFKGSETVWRDTQRALEVLGLNLPTWETTMEPGIKINKMTGEISFHN